MMAVRGSPGLQSLHITFFFAYGGIFHHHQKNQTRAVKNRGENADYLRSNCLLHANILFGYDHDTLLLLFLATALEFCNRYSSAVQCSKSQKIAPLRDPRESGYLCRKDVYSCEKSIDSNFFVGKQPKVFRH